MNEMGFLTSELRNKTKQLNNEVQHDCSSSPSSNIWGRTHLQNLFLSITKQRSLTKQTNKKWLKAQRSLTAMVQNVQSYAIEKKKRLSNRKQ